MSVEEERCWAELLELRTEAVLKYEDTSDNEHIVQYLACVREKLQDHRRDALQWLETFEGVSIQLEVVHAKRRIVAMYHQEIELMEQGIEAPHAVRARGDLIIHGNRQVFFSYMYSISLLTVQPVSIAIFVAVSMGSRCQYSKIL